MWKIFSFLKKKRVFSIKEFDKLVEKKAKDVREYVLSNLRVRDDLNLKRVNNVLVGLDVDDKESEEMFSKEFGKVFHAYQKNIYDKYRKLGLKKSKVKSPYLTFKEFLEQNATRKKSKFSFFYNFIAKTKIKLALIYIKLALIYYEIWIYFQIRKIKKLFPDMELSSKTALGILKSVKVNKKLMAIK